MMDDAEIKRFYTEMFRQMDLRELLCSWAREV